MQKKRILEEFMKVEKVLSLHNHIKQISLKQLIER